MDTALIEDWNKARRREQNARAQRYSRKLSSHCGQGLTLLTHEFSGQVRADGS